MLNALSYPETSFTACPYTCLLTPLISTLLPAIMGSVNIVTKNAAITAIILLSKFVFMPVRFYS